MSFAASFDLQASVYTRLTTASGVTDLVGSAVYDSAPAGALPELYVLIGEEDVSVRRDGTSGISRHRFDVSVVADRSGFAAAKAAAAAVASALSDAPLTVAGGTVLTVRLERSRAQRIDRNRKRLVEQRFVAVIDHH